jgi:hypothetical protein
VLANIEGMNAEFIHMGLAQGERLKRLNQIQANILEFRHCPNCTTRSDLLTTIRKTTGRQ